MPRFVILEHDHPYLHWDLMLESGDVLRTWRLAAQPTTGTSMAATNLFLHRKLYLDYEGPVSGQRGSVSRWDAGSYSVILEGPVEIVFEVRGSRLEGRVFLRHRSGDEWEFQVAPSRPVD
jgi:DNA polymerase Ligase (LigD)